ncbi:MAG: UDP-N-acetylmuramate--L-alanine ligase [bacterium]
MRYHFVGIAGSGMSALAQILSDANVSGSDRYYDLGINTELFDKFKTAGISMFKQDGSGIEEDVNKVIVSTAIEDDNPDIKKAREKNIPVVRRAELLAEIFNASKVGIGVTGTSGKTTTTAMIGVILHQLGLAPTIINGGIMKDFNNNCLKGNSELMIIEADESDGSCELYKPTIGVVTNIHLDHKPLDELEVIFSKFATNVKETLILNADCHPDLKSKTSFGIEKKATIHPTKLKLYPQKSHFSLENTQYILPLPGIHNVYNALAAIAVVKTLGFSDKEISEALGKFKGIKRRLEIVGKKKGITVIDDYAHNPDKIKATLITLKGQFPKVIVIFQPHGFGPTRLLKQGFIQIFKEELRPEDILYMPEIYYVGGTATKDISSNDIITALQKEGLQAIYCPERRKIIPQVIEKVSSGEAVIIMGARDDTLSKFCLDILAKL